MPLFDETAAGEGKKGGRLRLGSRLENFTCPRSRYLVVVVPLHGSQCSESEMISEIQHLLNRYSS